MCSCNDGMSLNHPIQKSLIQTQNQELQTLLAEFFSLYITCNGAPMPWTAMHNQIAVQLRLEAQSILFPQHEYF